MEKLKPLMGKRRQEQICKAMKGYEWRAPGTNSRKLTGREVATMRRTKSMTVSQLSRKYGVSRITVRRIRSRITWK